jgi:Xaa-Pro aminopeptidase
MSGRVRRERRAMIFSTGELAGRLARLRADLATTGLEGVVLTSWPGIFHATGAPIFQFGRPAAAIVPTAGEPAIVCSIIELEHVRAQSPITDVRTYRDFGLGESWTSPQGPGRSLGELVAIVVRDRGLERARLGFEDGSLPVRLFRALGEQLPSVAWSPASDLVDRQRLVKSEEELALLRAADAIADAGLASMLGILREGATARDMHEAGRTAMLERVLEHHAGVPFHLRIDTGLGSAERSAGHSEWATWDERARARPGQVLVLIADCILWGYTGNVERTVVIGEPPERIRRDFGTMVEANEAAIAMIRPGVTLADVDAACKAVLAAAGHGTRTGSGVGRGTISYEGGWRELLLDVRGYNAFPLEPGVAFSLEPDLQTADGTYRHCNTIVVTASGCEVDSKLPREVIVR